MTGHDDWSYVIHSVMSITINATQAKAELLSLIDRVANGESGPVTITKHGKAKVMLVAVSNGIIEPRGFGALRGQAIVRDGYDPFAPVLDIEPEFDSENLII